MIRRLRHLHRAYSIVVILVMSFLFFPLYYLASRRPAGYGFLNQLRKANSFIVSTLIGVFYFFKYEEPLKNSETYIYCANHTSNFDIMIMCILARGRFHFMGKDELLKNPVLGIFFKTIDVPVNRDSKISAFRAFKKAGDNLESGMSLIIFPEGRIDETHYPPQLQPFKNGPFRLAIDKKKTIVPVSISDVWKKMWDDGGRKGTAPGVCTIYVHKPILTNELTIDDADLLKDRIFEMINSKLVHQ